MMIERRYYPSQVGDAPDCVREAAEKYPAQHAFRWKRAGYTCWIKAYEMHAGNVVRTVLIYIDPDENPRSSALDFINNFTVGGHRVRRVPLHHLEPLYS